MIEGKNKHQAAVDAAFRAAKDAKHRRLLVDLAVRGKMAPESLGFHEIVSMCDFMLVHAECREPS